jgi:hypothetical protein
VTLDWGLWSISTCSLSPVLCKDTERQDSCHAAECQELAREDQAALRLLKKFGACCDAARTSPFSVSISVHFFPMSLIFGLRIGSPDVLTPWMRFSSIDPLMSSFEYFRTTRLLFVSICVFPMYRKQRGRKTKREKIVGVASSPQICYWHLLTVFPLKIPDINKKARENPLTVLLIWEGAAHQRRASDCGAACLTPGCAA